MSCTYQQRAPRGILFQPLWLSARHLVQCGNLPQGNTDHQRNIVHIKFDKINLGVQSNVLQKDISVHQKTKLKCSLLINRT